MTGRPRGVAKKRVMPVPPFQTGEVGAYAVQKMPKEGRRNKIESRGTAESAAMRITSSDRPQIPVTEGEHSERAIGESRHRVEGETLKKTWRDAVIYMKGAVH